MIQQIISQIIKQRLLRTIPRLVPRPRAPIRLVERKGHRALPRASRVGARRAGFGRLEDGGVALHLDERFGAPRDLCMLFE